VLEQDYRKYSGVIITENWITAIWENLLSCNSTLKATSTWKPQPNLKNNVAIVEALTKTGVFLPNTSEKSTAAGYTSESSTFQIYSHSMDRKSQPGHGRECEMEGVNRPGHGQVNKIQPIGKHGNWHSNN
jgi:hypothetical protein